MRVTRVDSASLTTGSCQPPPIALAPSPPNYEMASSNATELEKTTSTKNDKLKLVGQQHHSSDGGLLTGSIDSLTMYRGLSFTSS